MKKLNSTFVISFMGTDGSGKSTLINKLSEKLKKNYRKIKYLHLRPYLFLTDKSTVNKNPHNKIKPRTKFENLIRILIWLFMYYFFFSINLRKKNQLIIFDRYAHDLLIDKKRYRFNLSRKITKSILNLFPKPHLWVILKAPIKLIEKRKKEVSTKELKRQMNEYIFFAKRNHNSLTLNTSLNIHSNLKLIITKINSINL
jgi:thymidylate kinase